MFSGEGYEALKRAGPALKLTLLELLRLQWSSSLTVSATRLPMYFTYA